MATSKSKKHTPENTSEYQVIAPFQCPNKKKWYQAGEKVELHPAEAEFLLLGGKIQAVNTATKSKGATTNA